MLQKAKYTIYLRDENDSTIRIEDIVDAATAGEALKKGEFRNPGFIAVSARPLPKQSD